MRYALAFLRVSSLFLPFPFSKLTLFSFNSLQTIPILLCSFLYLFTVEGILGILVSPLFPPSVLELAPSIFRSSPPPPSPSSETRQTLSPPKTSSRHLHLHMDPLDLVHARSVQVRRKVLCFVKSRVSSPDLFPLNLVRRVEAPS